MARVLQQAPTFISTQQGAAEPLIKSLHALRHVNNASREAGAAEAVQVLASVLQQQAARNAGTLVVRAHQQPAQLSCVKFEGETPYVTSSTDLALHTSSFIWMMGWTLLDVLIGNAVTLDVDSGSTSRDVSGPAMP
jgi:hypothetical protein